MQIAGILSQKTQRTIKALYGGWRPFGRTAAGRIQTSRPWRRLSLHFRLLLRNLTRPRQNRQRPQEEICGVLIMKSRQNPNRT